MEATTDPKPVVLNAARPAPSFDFSKALRAAGVVLLMITGVLIWREVAMDAVVLLLVVSSMTMVGSFWLEKNKKEVFGPLLSFGAVIVSSGWYAAMRDPLALLAMGLGFVTFVVLSFVNRARSLSPHRALAFQGVAWSGLALSLAADFHVFHASELGDAGFLARRVILTVLWLVPGLASLVVGGKREDRALQAVGVVMTVAALGKLLAYDTIQLDGVLRIAAYGVAGVLTLIGGQLLTRKAPEAQS